MAPVRAPQAADFGPRTALKIVDAIRDDIRAGKVKTKDDVRSVFLSSRYSANPGRAVQQANKSQHERYASRTQPSSYASFWIFLSAVCAMQDAAEGEHCGRAASQWAQQRAAAR